MVALEWEDIQGNVLRSYGFKHAYHAVLTVADSAAGRRWLQRLVPQVTPATPWGNARPSTTLNVAFTHRGLVRLASQPEALSFPADFSEGMRARAAHHVRDLGVDGPEHWEAFGVHDPRAHVLLMVHAADTEAEPGQERFSQAIADARAHGLELLATETLCNLPNRTEHFGFVDGISQPAVEGAMGPSTVRGNGTPLEDGTWRPLRPGEFVLGYPDEEDEEPPLPSPKVLARNGSYLVYRKLSQDVAAFRRMITEKCQRHGLSPSILAAKLVGRHADGSPLVPGPADDPGASGPSAGPWEPTDAEGKAHLVEVSARLNDIRYEDDLRGQVCPVGSHIRRANPRDGFGLQPEFVSRHRMLRRGMPYGPPLPEGVDKDDGVPRGLLFVAYCANISRQFEFVQREWLNDGNPFGVGHTADPIAGHGSAARRFVCETGDPNQDPILLGDLPRLVQTMGGDYLFQPGLAALRYLATDG